jgi:hypothetical protein
MDRIDPQAPAKAPTATAKTISRQAFNALHHLEKNKMMRAGVKIS